MNKPVCVKCGRICRPEKNGVVALEKKEDGSDYRIYHADKWKCPVCGYEVLHGFGEPVYPFGYNWELYKRNVEMEFV